MSKSGRDVVQRGMRYHLLLAALVACAPHGGGFVGDAGKPASAKDAAADVSVDAPVEASTPDSGQTLDSGDPADTGAPPDSGPGPDSGWSDSGTPDSGVPGRCQLLNSLAKRNCTQLTDFSVTVQINQNTWFTADCLQNSPPCPLGWQCNWLPNGEPGTCVP